MRPKARNLMQRRFGIGVNTLNGNGIKVDRKYLRLYPDARGPQHDARESKDLGAPVHGEKSVCMIAVQSGRAD